MKPVPKWVWILVVVVAAVIVLVDVRGAQGSAILDKPRLMGIVATPLYNDDGTLASFHVTANFRVLEMRPDGKTPQNRILPVSFDLAQQGDQSLVIGTSIVDFKDIGNDLIGVTEYVWKVYHPDALPQRRKTLREVPAPPIP